MAGLQSRKIYGLDLWKQGIASRILLSVGRYEIRRFAALGLPIWSRLWELRSETLPAKRHFFVSFDGSTWDVVRIPVRPLGTLSEIRALGDWLQEQPQITSVLVVSSGPHLRRVGICCSKLLPRRVTFCLTPERNRGDLSATSADSLWGLKSTELLLEGLKLLLYVAVLKFYKFWNTLQC